MQVLSTLQGSCGIHLRMSCRKLELAILEEGRRRRSILVELSVLDRGRDAHYWAPPAQRRTCDFPAYGAHLGCLTAKR